MPALEGSMRCRGKDGAYVVDGARGTGASELWRRGLVNLPDRSLQFAETPCLQHMQVTTRSLFASYDSPNSSGVKRSITRRAAIPTRDLAQYSGVTCVKSEVDKTCCHRRG